MAILIRVRSCEPASPLRCVKRLLIILNKDSLGTCHLFNAQVALPNFDKIEEPNLHHGDEYITATS